MRALVLMALLVGALGLCVAAEVPSGIGSVAFARLGVDARVLGMGGAFSGVADGHPIPLYNPAALALARNVDVGTMYAAPYGFDLGIAYQYASAVLPIQVQTESARGVGAAVTWMSLVVSDIMIWDEENPGNTASFTATDSIYMGSVGLELVEGLCAGAAAKLYRERILDGRAEGFGVDLGLIGTFRVAGVPMSIGLNSMDIGQTLVKWRGTAGNPENYIPWINKLGVSVLVEELSILAAADFDWGVGRPRAEQVFRAGVEWKPVEPIALRGGWRMSLDGRSTVSFGIGFRAFSAVSLDYAYVLGGDIDAAHFASVHILF
jgi:hypothetical protein